MGHCNTLFTFISSHSAVFPGLCDIFSISYGWDTTRLLLLGRWPHIYSGVFVWHSNYNVSCGCKLSPNYHPGCCAFWLHISTLVSSGKKSLVTCSQCRRCWHIVFREKSPWLETLPYLFRFLFLCVCHANCGLLILLNTIVQFLWVLHSLTLRWTCWNILSWEDRQLP